MASDPQAILRLGFGGTLFRHRPGIDDIESSWRWLKDWIMPYRPTYFIPTSRCGYYLFKGIARFKEKYPALVPRLHVQLWGNIDPENKRQTVAMGIQDIVSIDGYSDRQASRAKLDACDALFLPLELAKLGHKPLLIPGKVYEYLQAGKPVLTIGQDSDAVDIMRLSGLGIICDPNDVEVIADSLKMLILEKDHLGTLFVPDQTYIGQFDFKQLTVKLADVFEELSNEADYTQR